MSHLITQFRSRSPRWYPLEQYRLFVGWARLQMTNHPSGPTGQRQSFQARCLNKIIIRFKHSILFRLLTCCSLLLWHARRLGCLARRILCLSGRTICASCVSFCVRWLGVGVCRSVGLGLRARAFFRCRFVCVGISLRSRLLGIRLLGGFRGFFSCLLGLAGLRRVSCWLLTILGRRLCRF